MFPPHLGRPLYANIEPTRTMWVVYPNNISPCLLASASPLLGPMPCCASWWSRSNLYSYLGHHFKAPLRDSIAGHRLSSISSSCGSGVSDIASILALKPCCSNVSWLGFFLVCCRTPFSWVPFEVLGRGGVYEEVHLYMKSHSN